jgi:hypothetical protein
MNKIMLATGMMVGFAYATEFFIAWYGGNPYESFAFVNRAFGPYAWAYWIMVSCNVITPQLFWFKKIRTNSHRGDAFIACDRQRRHVVRALRHHGDLAQPRLPARRAGVTTADPGWSFGADLRGQLRSVLHPLPAVLHPLRRPCPMRRHGRGEDRHALSGAPPELRRGFCCSGGPTPSTTPS